LPGGGADLPGAVLFACSRNAVRSPMAAAILRHLAGRRIYVESAGVRAGETILSPLPSWTKSASTSRDIARPRSAMCTTSFDLIVTLSPEAHHKALELAGAFAIDVEYWPTPDPTMTSGNREQILTAYRGVRDGLFRRIKQRFPVAGAPNV